MKDAYLIPKLQAGDSAGFYGLDKRYRKKIIVICRYRFRFTKEVAEEILDDVLMAVKDSIHSFREKAELATWIDKITESKCLNKIKEDHCLKRFNSSENNLQADEVEYMIPGGIMPDEALHENEIKKKVMQVINTLPARQREAFIKSKLEGYKYPEIAKIMNTTISAVKNLISHALKKIGGKLLAILKKND